MGKENSAIRILNGLNEFLHGQEFKFSKSNKEFIRRTETGFHRVSLIGRSPSRGQYASGLPLYEGTIILGVRFDAVEDILSPLDLVVGQKNQSRTTTASRPIHGYYPFKRFRDRPIKIGYKNTNIDLEKAIHRVQRMLSTDGVDWFRTYSGLEAYQNEINSHPWNKPTNLFNNLEGRIYRGVAAASLCEGTQKANEVAMNYLEASRRLSHDTRNRIEDRVKLIIKG